MEISHQSIFNVGLPRSREQRQIIHVDMDCFYAAVEMRDDPGLAGKPVAVGGSVRQRGVVCASNYLARRWGVRSAMLTAEAYRHCPELIVLPVNMPKYRQVAQSIKSIFQDYTDLVEPLSLDEAYLDVSASTCHFVDAPGIAQMIRRRIWEKENLTASAGVASTKFLAKIASAWKKPNGLCVIPFDQEQAFIDNLPVDALYGVGKVTAQKLHAMHLHSCADLKKRSLGDLIHGLGQLGARLYEQCRGIDPRPVQPNRPRKSLSVERTFWQDKSDIPTLSIHIEALYQQLLQRLATSSYALGVKQQFIKVKFSDFKLKTAETTGRAVSLATYLALFDSLYPCEKKSVRLIGIGVRFHKRVPSGSPLQQALF